MKIRFTRHGAARRRGFSLAELMVVVVILGLLATVVVPNVLGRLKTAQVQKAKTDIVSIANAVEVYTIENGGKYPDTLEVLIMEDEHGKRILRGYDSVPADPWKHEYQYEPPSGDEDYRVFSYGADGQPGGEGDDADIDNWSIKAGK